MLYAIYADVRSPQCLDFQVLPNPASRTFTLFSTMRCNPDNCGHALRKTSIDYYVVSVDGQTLQQNTFVVPLPEDEATADASIINIQPIDRKGGFCISISYDHHPRRMTKVLHFDETLQTFRMPPPQADSPFGAWWNGSFYIVVAMSERAELPPGSAEFWLEHIGFR